MDNKRADISQIQKYLNGELDAKAMHQLEREAQHDPFLMDALEGYDLAKAGQQDNIAALQARLNERTATKTRRMIPWAVTAVAAVVTGFAVILGVLYHNNQNVSTNTQVAMNQPAKNKQPDTALALSDKSKAFNAPGAMRYAPSLSQEGGVKQPVFAGHVKRQRTTQPLSEIAIADAAPVAAPAADSPSLDETVVMSYMAANKKTDTVLLGGDKIATTNNYSSLNILKSKADGAMMKPAERSQNSAYALAKANLPPNLVKGVVIDRRDGMPLPGVSVNVVGKPIGTQTDVNGKFTLPNVKKDENLAFGYVGYGTKTLALRGSDSLKIELEGSTNSLSEVVVVNTKPVARQPKAHPRTGWDNFKSYLTNNAVAPNDKEGAVTLQFTVSPDGSLKNIKVIKKLNPGADQEAIRLLQQGPPWVGNTSGKPEAVEIKISFKKAVN
ncbi:energy transducer TonB [Mucilaginibacter phyllosphaerae]|uniref:TonB family protein n=1 Tax=Mucilaginibacter phyllosphaerae TaxID=1812349 RepID=A0A4Y8ABQ9_9SPHI|nr:carboxypeptidase-like regulatory domain-containing protein [Mucilaginibacter phyllosphaerae]MBB3969976.1 TonB family protein [Mucilaginibacter phyllosphaerae]TEW65345.1 hypothetical protein E2R65_15665 [Mucilaginibacter phyllosphaerae]GGH16465.1 hypothetical protein GCM10007352_25880 [Mucilaginibacter phyllosphaerae]